MGPRTTATTVGLFPLAAIPPQTSRDLLPLTFKPRCGVSKASFLEKLAYPFLQVRWEDVVVWHNRFLQLHRCGLRRETCVQCLLRNVYPDAYALPPTQAEVRVWPLPWRGACQWLRAGVVLPIA